MNTLQLECFIAVAENLNFAKAAEIVHMSQPAVTKRIQSLEEELEILLFERDTRHVVLTYAGKQFYSSAKSILLQEKSALSSLAQLRAAQKRALVIGSHNTEIYSYLGSVLERVYQTTTDIKPDIIDVPFQSLSLALASGSVDIVVGTYEMMQAAGLSAAAFCGLTKSPVYCVASSKLKNRMPKSLRISELTLENVQNWSVPLQRITCGDLDRYFTENPQWHAMLTEFTKDTLVCDSMDAAICMTEAGMGVMLIPEADFLLSDKFHYVPVVDAAALNYGYFYNPENKNPVLSLFRRKLEEYFAEEI